MAFYPNVPFAAGDDWTPEIAYQAFNQVFDDQTQYLGHRPRIADTDLSNTAGQIKQRVAAIEEAFKVTVDSGRTLRYQSGVVRLPEGDNLSVASALVTAPDNTTSFVYINQTGSVICDTNPPAIRVLLAKVVTASGAVSTIEDLRHPALRIIQPIVSSIKVFGGSNTTDKTCTANEVFDQGFYYFRNFTVPAGITITIDKWARFYCSGKVDINGTINVTTIASGATAYATPLSTTNVGGLTGSGIGAGSGSSAGGGSAYPYGAQSHGSGGGQGFAAGNGAAVLLGAGGKGGGGLWIEASGVITVTGSIAAIGEPGVAGQIYSGSARISGSGGGSGGLVLLSSLRSVAVTSTATIDVRGGAGANAVSNATGNGAVGGSGGGGGQVVLISPTNNTTGSTILLSGGSQGASAGTTPDLGGGGGGGFGGQGGQQAAGSVGKLVVRPFAPIGS